MISAFFRNAIEKLLGLGEFAAPDCRPCETGQRFDVAGIALQYLRIECAGAGMIPLLLRLFSHSQGFLDRRGAAAPPAAEALNELLDLALGHGADEAVNRPPILERVNRRDRLNAHLLGNLGVLVDIDLDHPNSAVGGANGLFEDRPELLAGAAPR